MSKVAEQLDRMADEQAAYAASPHNKLAEDVHEARTLAKAWRTAARLVRNAGGAQHEAPGTIPSAAILAAESAVFDAMIEHGPDGHTDGHDKIARGALEAAASIIRAQALEDAAAALRLVGRDIDPWGKPTRENYADWVAARAAAERGGGIAG